MLIMLKKYNPKFTIGSLFICSKCGKDFSAPDASRAENLKTDLRTELKNIEAQSKVRVMVGSCLGVCAKDEQAFAYYPNEPAQNAIEVYTASSDLEQAKKEILDFIKSKI